MLHADDLIVLHGQTLFSCRDFTAFSKSAREKKCLGEFTVCTRFSHL